VGSEEIAYQNKDITSKVLAENFKGKTFRVYGLDLPEIREVKPTNIPAVKANELRLDNLFELEDETVAIVDYESKYDQADKVKYLNYLAGIASRYQKEKEECPRLRMIVIYTGDIRKEQVSIEYDIGAIKMNIEPAFLSEMDGGAILQHLKEKVDRNELLTDEELMEMIILPLSYREKQEKEKRIYETVNLAVRMQDRGQQVFALAGILAFTDKIIDRETANKIRRAIEMTQVAMIFEEEKQQALTQAARIFEEEKRHAVETEKKKAADSVKAERKKNADFKQQTVMKMIEKGYSTEEIVSLVSGYSENKIDSLRKKMQDSTGSLQQ